LSNGDEVRWMAKLRDGWLSNEIGGKLGDGWPRSEIGCQVVRWVANLRYGWLSTVSSEMGGYKLRDEWLSSY
jgi:hypothetical protein